ISERFDREPLNQVVQFFVLKRLLFAPSESLPVEVVIRLAGGISVAFSATAFGGGTQYDFSTVPAFCDPSCEIENLVAVSGLVMVEGDFAHRPLNSVEAFLAQGRSLD